MNVLQESNDVKIEEPLWTSYALGDSLILKNRVVMAPMTRSMASDSLVPTAEMARYYGRRADAGLIITEATIVRLGEKSITYEFHFSHDGRPVATGRTTTVCCRFDDDGAPRSIAIPEWVAQKLQEFVVP